MEKVFFDRLPGYSLLRSLTQRMAGDTDEHAWQPVLVELEDALVPAFIIEELDRRSSDGLRAVSAYTARRSRLYPLP